tara:strand:- start:109 stop:924 length:816 start_codon:yes stop_codon:yes gene_type:complete
MIDCHLHLQDSAFDEVREKVVGDLRRAGVRRLVVNGTGPEDWDEVSGLAGRITEVIPFYGVHPWKSDHLPENWEDVLRQLLSKSQKSGVGEIGLDKWIRHHDIEKQRDIFLRQLKIADELSRAVTVHCLKAWGHLLDCLRISGLSRPFLLHSYTGPAELISELIELGAYFSLSGYFFREEKAAKLELFESIPDERILLETDAPEMMPPMRLVRDRLPDQADGREVNHPANIVAIYEAFASWRGISMRDCCLRMDRNFSAWYGQTTGREPLQ